MKNNRYLLLPVVIIIGMATQVGTVAASSITSDDVISQVNNVRTSQHLPVLNENKRLDQSAAARAKDMCEQSYFDHVSPTGDHTADFVTAAGYKYQIAGENLAEGFTTTEDAVAAWVASPTHYRNIIRSVYTETGVALYDCLNYQGKAMSTIIVQHFGQPEITDAMLQQAKKDSTHKTSSFLMGCAIGFVVMSAFIGFRRSRKE